VKKRSYTEIKKKNPLSLQYVFHL